MENIILILNELRKLTGNEQLNYLKANKNDTLKQILMYTYDPHKKYKIDEGKYLNVTSEKKENSLTLFDWAAFIEKLDWLSNLKSAKDEHVKEVKDFIYQFKENDFLEKVLFKDLRLNMSVKKFQKVWSDFCVEPQVQLANKWQGEVFQNGFYSRKLDGLRCYYLNGIPYSRANKLQNTEPLEHITAQIVQVPNYKDKVFDGEIVYLKDGIEDFQKAVSLVRSEKRNSECAHLYFVIFDCIDKEQFLNQKCGVCFKDSYIDLKNTLNTVNEEISWFTTTYSNLLIMKQVSEEQAEQLREYCDKLHWEGLMYRDGNAPYQCKRSSSILKIKRMQDIELKLVAMEEGTGKHKGKLGAFIVDYKGFYLNVGSGFSDEQREEYWNNQNKYIGEFVKVQYFEKTKNQQGEESLRFPVFLSFRNNEGEFLIK